MTKLGEVVDLASWRSTQESYRLAPKAYSSSEVQTEKGRETRIEDLYPAIDESGVSIARARSLLREAASRADDAREALGEGDVIGADQQTMLLQSVLPDLFCMRGISEGMAAFVLSLFHGLVNLRGKPMSLDQCYAASKALSFISDNPFLPFDAASDLVEKLEEVGLDVEPAIASDLGYLLAEVE